VCSDVPHWRAVQAAVGHPEVVLGRAQIELVHGRKQPCGARCRAQQLRELLRNVRVRVARCRTIPPMAFVAFSHESGCEHREHAVDYVLRIVTVVW
jgi:hypothetical protein